MFVTYSTLSNTPKQCTSAPMSSGRPLPSIPTRLGWAVRESGRTVLIRDLSGCKHSWIRARNHPSAASSHEVSACGRCAQCECKLQSILMDISTNVLPIARAIFRGATLSGRVKSIASAMDKSTRRTTSPALLSDLIGIRVLVSNVEQCYQLSQALRYWFIHRRRAYDDYIAHPKSNGYRSLHTVIRHSSGHAVEVQVRTSEMHAAAERGCASHEIYKSGQTKLNLTVAETLRGSSLCHPLPVRSELLVRRTVGDEFACSGPADESLSQSLACVQL